MTDRRPDASHKPLFRPGRWRIPSGQCGATNGRQPRPDRPILQTQSPDPAQSTSRGGGLTAITAQNMASKPTWSPAPRDTSRMLYGSATIARPIARSTRFWKIKSQRKRLRLHWRSGCSLFLLLPRMSRKAPSPFPPPGRSPHYGGNAGPRGPAMPMLYRLRKICLRTYELINFSTTMCAIKSARCNDYANISFGIYSVKQIG